jgi:hypothetical protein
MPDAARSFFEQLFPKVKEIKTTVRQVGEQPEPKSHIFTKDNWPHSGIKCINKRCRGGGYDLNHIVQDMVENNITHQNIRDGILCPGRTVMGNTGRRGPSCPQRLECEIHILFREDSPPQAGDK